MNKKDDKRKQIRKTREDTIYAQNELRQLINRKIKSNGGLNSFEKGRWMRLLADALVSWGKTTKVYYDMPGTRIPLGSVHTFGLKFLDWDNPVDIEHDGIVYRFQICALWRTLYKYVLIVFPMAIDEALHISKESEEYEPWSGFDFSSRKSLEREY